jgi:MFS family permease
MFAAASIIGKYFDAYGPRVILLVGTFLHVFGLMMASISTDLWHFILSQGLISATGASMIFTPALSSVSTWFFYRRAFVLGITAAGSSIGGVVFPIMIRRLIVLVGFGWSMRITAFVILFLMVLANLTVRSRLPTKTFIPLSIRDFTKPFAEIPFSLTVVAAFLFFFGMFLPFNYLPLFGLSRGMSASMSNYLISILNAASVFGRIIPGYISDKVGRFNMTTIITLVSGLSVLAMWIPANNSGSALTIVFSGVYGFTTGAFVSLGPALIAQISDIKEIGVRTGAMYAVVSIGVLTGSPIGGALLSSRGWLGMEVFSGVVLVAGGIIFVLARLSLVGTRIRAVV